MGLKFYIPVVCYPNGWYGGNFCCLARSPEHAFRLMMRRIKAGKVHWHGRRS